jgi:hypothetical protein
MEGVRMNNNGILVCHTGTDTWFTLHDTGYIISFEDAWKHDDDGDLADANSLSDIASTHGYCITPELADLIYATVVSYYESEGKE